MTIRFRLRKASQSAAACIESKLGLPRFVAATLAARGIESPEEAQAFINPSLEFDWRNPYELPAMQEVVDALTRAIDDRKHIVVFGDFDLDGVSATTVLTRGIRALGGKATPFIPKRFTEGYGITEAAVKRMKELEPDVVITVDCGISCKCEVEQLTDAGIEVLITDHHEAGTLVPVDVPVCDPKLTFDSPNTILAGVGVALKVVQALGSRKGFPYLWRSYTDFATLGTIADRVPMVGQNRALVTDGLQKLNESPRPCIEALRAVCGTLDKELTSTNLSFSLIPRLNAAGRMGDAQLALDLLMSDSFEEANEFAAKLEETNNLRRIKEAELASIAKEQASDVYAGERSLVVAGIGWHEGVKGIVASRLVNQYGVPCVLFTIENDEARGSGRSVGSVNLFKAVESTSDLLTRFGGHEAAVGVTLPADKLPEFTRRLNEYMEKLPQEDFEPMTDVDVCVGLSELTLENVAALDVLAPFGQDNPVPVFLAKNVALEKVRAVGADKNHLSCALTDGLYSIDAILFHCENLESLLYSDRLVNAAFTVQIDEWRGRRNVKAMLEVLAPANSCCACDSWVDPEMAVFFKRLFMENDLTASSICRRRHGCHSAEAPAHKAYCEKLKCARRKWEDEARQNPEALIGELVSAVIGNNNMHAAQSEILDRLREGISTLGVMATGRGKSLVFQVFAALQALQNKKVSLFVYPLRALMADQAYHMDRQFAAFGLRLEVLNGESTIEERDRIYAGLQAGEVDIVLTTPEYLELHADKIAECGRIGFMVIDEAHHIGLAKAGNRISYGKLDDVVAKLGRPTVLAVTATAPSDVASKISRVLPIEDSVVDNSSRDNLHIDDRRNIKNRDDYLACVIANGGKCIVYVNSREQSVGVARRLRRRVPQLAMRIGFYNAGLSRDERLRIESLFRKGELQVLVSTSAFGEGIDIPDIRHVVLYHMPFSDVEFNQMSGRAGRDGRDAWVHLLYGKQDYAINEGILTEMTPARDVMAQVYSKIREEQRKRPGCWMRMGFEQLADLVSDDFRIISTQACECGLSVFSELGLIDCKQVFNNGVEEREFRINENAPEVELTDSVRYREGLDEMDSFRAFRDWAMRCDLHGISMRITHPITPSNSEGND